MKKLLKKTDFKVWHVKNGTRVEGAPDCVSGDLSGVRGDLSGVEGDLSGVRGNLSGVRGDLDGVSGNLDGVWGNLDSCEISDADRAKGVRIDDLIDTE